MVTDGNRASFGQNAGLRRRLLDTGAAILAEAIPRDYLWGIGLAESDPDVFNRVVLIHIKIAVCLQMQIKSPMPCK